MQFVSGNKLLLILGAAAIAGSLSVSILAAAQTMPYRAKDVSPANRATGVRITEGPSLESFRNNEAIIRWTSNNPGGTDEHFGLVKYGTDPHNLNLTAKGHIRLNRNHPYTVFRVRLERLQPGRIYYYSVHSTEADGTDDGMTSEVYRLNTPGGTNVNSASN